ncbi:hypothetical protein TI04_02880 [Achromatium sp. WMS2]|nr:hypothetical protein TI04_02880 [Achromatium sp. WMS2]
MSKIFRKILVFIGLLTVVFVSTGSVLLWLNLTEFNPNFIHTYWNFSQRVLANQDLGLAMIRSVPVDEGITVDDLVDSIKSLATSRNLLFAGESKFSEHVTTVTGKPYPYTNFLSFCDSQAGKLIVDYQPAYTAFMPCRLAITKDKTGRLWLHSINLELLIQGGKERPPEVQAAVVRVWDNLKAVMDEAARGDF